MFKKILSLFLVLSFLFAFSACSNTSNLEFAKKSIVKDEVIDLDLNSSEDFIAQLDEEGIDVEDSYEYDICILIEISESETVKAESFSATNIGLEGNLDQALFKHRQKVKHFYTSYNEKMVKKLGLSKYSCFVSFYSPYIEIVFDDAKEYVAFEKEWIDSLQIHQNLISSMSNCIVYTTSKDEATINASDYFATYALDQAFNDIGVSNTQYTGQGIKVGVIESGVPQSTVNLKANHYTFLHTNETKHSLVVSSIIGGTSGIAKDVYFYFASSTGFVENANILIDTCGVNIINMSFGSFENGNYTNKDACIDTIVSNTGCTIVKSSGNRGTYSEDPYYITAPGCSMNAITVGSIDYNKNISDFSSWFASDDFLLKPDVVAPGGILWDIPNIPNVDENGIRGHSGTSYAAPMVVGTIALLMEEFPILKTNPALVKSVLHLGAEPLPSQTNYFDQQAGFGLINYQNMRNCLLNSNYSNFTIPTNTRPDDILLSKSISIPYLDTLKINANTIINSSEAEFNGTPATPSYTEYFIIIYDTSTDEYVDVSIIDSSVDYLVFTNTNPNNTSYIIEVMAMENSRSSATEYGSIAYEIVEHDHSFTDRYVWQSHLQHKCYCECGRYSTAAHVVLQGDFPAPGDYAICLRCRGEVSMGVLQSIPIGLPHTDNGSYILTNGTIVLVEEDVEAYMAGTLKFYYGEKE